MSELCKIESPISLHLMSLNFEKRKKERGGRERNRRGERADESGEEEEEEGGLGWRAVHRLGGSLHNIRVGVSVCERLQNVCVRAQLWVSESGLYCATRDV